MHVVLGAGLRRRRLPLTRENRRQGKEGAGWLADGWVSLQALLPTRTRRAGNRGVIGRASKNSPVSADDARYSCSETEWLQTSEPQNRSQPR